MMTEYNLIKQYPNNDFYIALKMANLAIGYPPNTYLGVKHGDKDNLERPETITTKKKRGRPKKDTH